MVELLITLILAALLAWLLFIIIDQFGLPSPAPLALKLLIVVILILFLLNRNGLLTNL